jgi:hypothetical protein
MELQMLRHFCKNGLVMLALGSALALVLAGLDVKISVCISYVENTFSDVASKNI